MLIQIESKGGNAPTEAVEDSTLKILQELGLLGRMSDCHNKDPLHFYLPDM